jgi:hypothetical protein
MTRLKPTTAKKVHAIRQELRDVADEISPARPLLAGVYRSLVDGLDLSLYPNDASFSFWLPPGSKASIIGRRVEIYRG